MKHVFNSLFLLIRRLSFFILVMGVNVSQASRPGFITDTIFFKPGDYIIFEDSSFYAQSDTFLIIPDDLDYVSSVDHHNQGKTLYDSISGWAGNKPLLNNLVNLMIVKDSKTKKDTKSKIKGLEQNREHEGKIINQIKILKIDVFGQGINDTLYLKTKNGNSFLNSTHIKTRDKVILNNLLIESGDNFNPSIIMDNERILRALPFIDDARIIPIPVSENEVDILVITKDVYSLGAALDFDRLNSGLIRLYDLNLFGIGHRLQANIFFDYNEEASWGYGGSYSSENLFGTFIKTKLSYLNAFETETFYFSAKHNFITPEVKYSYGLIQQVSYTQAEFDTAVSPYPLRFYYQDYWVGRSFQISKNRNRIILSGRYTSNNIYERPEIQNREYHQLQTYSLYLASLAYSKENYYRMNLIYNYGRTEDIPYGTLWNLTAGYESNEFFQSFYSSLEASYGSILPQKGYIYVKLGFGGFYNEHVFDRGIFQVQSHYFSKLMKLKRFQIRQFVKFDYTNGIRRFEDEFIGIGGPDGIRGLRSDSLTGTQRLVLNLETVAFSPYYLYGFRFTFYTFADLGFIGASTDAILNREMYSGFGIGVRIRNENLAFRTFQIRFGFYPILPATYTARFIEFSGETYYRPGNFTTNRPSIIDFR